MEKLYQEIYDRKPAKKGTAYELIVGAVLKLLNQDANITHNVFLKSPYSADKYQIDNLHETDELTFVETKDYSEKGRKVGRPDISKFAGALCVLKDNINKGLLTSSTDFTKPAKQFTCDFLKSNSIPIDLLVIRKSISADTEGTIRKVVVNMKILFPDFQRAIFVPKWTKDGVQVLKDLGYRKGGAYSLNIWYFYKSDGLILETASHLISKLDADYKTLLAEGKWEFDEPAYIKVNETSVAIERIEYKVPYVIYERSIEIDAGEPAILVSSMDGELYRIISVEDLRKIDARENGTYNMEDR